jgi:hypothetical protein
MRVSRTLLFTAVAAAAVAGVATAAALNTHTLTVRLPDGGVERIIYTGNVAPRVEVAPSVAAVPVVWPSLAGFDDTAFAAIDQMSARMDREMAAMLRQADAMEARALAGPNALTSVSTGDTPSGARSLSYISTLSGGGVCSRSVEITSTGDGQAPRVVKRSSGDCGASAAPPPLRSPTAAAMRQRTELLDASYRPAAQVSRGDGPA